MDEAETRAADAGEKDPFNEIFYKTDPYNYLIQRVVSLIAMKDHGSDVLGLLPEALEIAESQFGRIQPSEQTKTDQWRFVTAESEVILHHVSETLLRLYLAHVNRPERPWIVLARERSPGKFKDLAGDLCRRIREGQEAESIHQVFHGTRSRLAIGNPAPPWPRSGQPAGRTLPTSCLTSPRPSWTQTPTTPPSTVWRLPRARPGLRFRSTRSRLARPPARPSTI